MTENKGDLISREALKEDFKSRLADCNEWIEKAKDKETKIRASAVKAFIGEVIMTIDNAPTIKTFTLEDIEEQYRKGLEKGLSEWETERPQGEWKTTGAYPHKIYCNKCFKTYAQENWEVWKDGSLPRNFCPNCGAEMDGSDYENLGYQGTCRCGKFNKKVTWNKTKEQAIEEWNSIIEADTRGKE